MYLLSPCWFFVIRLACCPAKHDVLPRLCIRAP